MSDLAELQVVQIPLSDKQMDAFEHQLAANPASENVALQRLLATPNVWGDEITINVKVADMHGRILTKSFIDNE